MARSAAACGESACHPAPAAEAGGTGQRLLRAALLCDDEPDSQSRRILAEASDECRTFAGTLPRRGLLAVLATIAATGLSIVSPFLLLPHIQLSVRVVSQYVPPVLVGVLIFGVAPLLMFFRSVLYKRALFNPASGSSDRPATELPQASTQIGMFTAGARGFRRGRGARTERMGIAAADSLAYRRHLPRGYRDTPWLRASLATLIILGASAASFAVMNAYSGSAACMPCRLRPTGLASRGHTAKSAANILRLLRAAASSERRGRSLTISHRCTRYDTGPQRTVWISSGH